jgi:gliding motility-associated-like protein
MRQHGDPFYTSLDPVHLCAIEATTSLLQPLCYGDNGVLTISATVGLEPFTVSWRHSLLPVTGTDLIASSPGEVAIELTTAGLYYVDIISANGLSVSDTLLMDDIKPLVVTATTQTDAFGYQIACAGDTTGFAMAILESPGTPPYQYRWSDGSVSSQISQLASGQYTVTVTDNHGCVTSDSVLLTAPLPMQYSLIVEDIECYGLHNGRIEVASIQGGVQPWSTSLDGGLLQPQLVYDALRSGNHTLAIIDQQGCSSEDQFTILEPENWWIDLGQDTIVAFGKPYTLEATLMGIPYGTLQTIWSDGQCDDCLTRTVTPESATIYGLSAIDANGCVHEDEIRLDVFIDRALYVPNVFSPNGDQINDLFILSAGSGLREIEEITIYDRWGSLVYQAFHFAPDDPDYAWDGTQRGQPLNPGVYVYTLKAIFQDNLILSKSGDITLIR